MSTQLTQEEFERRVKNKNHLITILGNYISSRENIDCRCDVCGYLWSPLAGTLTQGHGCPRCKGTVPRTHEWFVNKMEDINKNITYLSEYVTSKSNIDCKCNICGNVWSTTPNKLLNGRGCPICIKKLAGIRRRKTNEQFLEDVANNNPTIKPLELYQTAYRKMKFKCLICGHEFMHTPVYISTGAGSCPSCSETHKNTHEEFIQKLSATNNNIQVLSEYQGNKQDVLCECLIDGTKWYATPNNLLRGTGCPTCGAINRAKHRTKSHKKFIEDVSLRNPSIEILSEYKGISNKILCKCKLCRGEWETLAKNIIIGAGCPKCSQSKGEQRITCFLDKYNIDYISQMHFSDLPSKNPKGRMTYDFYLTQYNVLIEYQGEQHEHPIEYFGGEKSFKDQQRRDNIKREYAKSHNIPLLEIWYWDFSNIEDILIKELHIDEKEAV